MNDTRRRRAQLQPPCESHSDSMAVPNPLARSSYVDGVTLYRWPVLDRWYGYVQIRSHGAVCRECTVSLCHIALPAGKKSLRQQKVPCHCAAAALGMSNGLMPCMPSSVTATFWISLPPTNPAQPGEGECRKATLARTEKRRVLWRDTEKCVYP